jgi:ADP-heptose:LPS heptosyltransferase
MPDPLLKRIELGLRRTLITTLVRLSRRTRQRGELALADEARILLLRHDRFGDAVVSTAIIKLLRDRLPGARIDILLGHRNRTIAPLLPAIDGTLVVEAGIRGLFSVRSELRRRRYDVVINLLAKDSSSGALLAVLSGARVRIGFEGALSDIYDFAVLRPNRPMHIVPQTALLLAPFGIAPLADAPRREREMLELCVGIPTSETGPRSIVERAPRIVVSISARDDVHTWPDRNIPALVRALAGEGFSWTVVGTAAHRVRVEAIVAAEPSIEALPPTDSFAAFVASLAAFDIIVTPQTSTVHVGSALRRATILLNTTSESDSQWTPWGVPSRTLAGETLAAIPVDDVALAVRSLVAELRGTA